MFINQNITACLAFLDIPKQFLMNRFSVQWSNSGVIKISWVQVEDSRWSLALMSGHSFPFSSSCAQCSRDCYILARPAEIPSLDHSLRKMVKPAGTKSEKFVPGRGCDYFSGGNSHPNTQTSAQNWLIAQFDSLRLLAIIWPIFLQFIT